jgi:hypothetical protein
MAKYCSDDVLDAALTYLKTNCDKMVACSSLPANYAGVAAVTLADAAMASGDFTIADGDTSGRKLTVAEKTGEEVDANGSATHVALVDTANSKLLYVTEATPQVLTEGNPLTFQSWDIEIADPA